MLTMIGFKSLNFYGVNKHMEIEQIKKLYDAMMQNNFTQLKLEIKPESKIKLVLEPCNHRLIVNEKENSLLEANEAANHEEVVIASVEDKNNNEIISEKVGVFQIFENVALDTLVEKGQVLGTINGISFNEVVKATTSGIIDKVWVDDGDIVDYGKKLFTIKSGEQ